jgi:hypothetical protein
MTREVFEAWADGRLGGYRWAKGHEWEAWQEAMRQSVPAGWKLVPVEPTVEQKIAGDNAGWWCADKYRAMIDAAPEYKP